MDFTFGRNFVNLVQAMFTMHQIVKRSVAETDPVQCEQEEVFRCVAGITTFQKMEQSNPAQEQKLFRKKRSQCEQKHFLVQFLQSSILLSGTV